MAITNGYATLAELKATKKITSTNAADDAFIEDLVEAASRYIDNTSGHRFYTTGQDETRVFSPDYTDMVEVGDLISVTTLKTDLDGDRTYETTWATTDYDLMPDNAALKGKPYWFVMISPNGAYSFPNHRRSLQIVGKFGYSTTRPDDINIACIEIVIQLYLNRFGNNTSGAATITGAGVVITPNDIPSSAQAIINSYKGNW